METALARQLSSSCAGHARGLAWREISKLLLSQHTTPQPAAWEVSAHNHSVSEELI